MSNNILISGAHCLPAALQGQKVNFGAHVGNVTGRRVFSAIYEWVELCTKSGLLVWPLANNVLGGWVITDALWIYCERVMPAFFLKPLCFLDSGGFFLLWNFSFDSSYACALQTSPQNLLNLENTFKSNPQTPSRPTDYLIFTSPITPFILC